MRDKLSHGQDFDEVDLPAYSIQYLVQKYLGLHITAPANTPHTAADR